MTTDPIGDMFEALRVKPAPFDPYCNTPGSEMSYLDFMNYDEDGKLGDNPQSRDDLIRENEGTYNPATGHFACDECYINIGMPSSPSGWKAP